MHLKGDQYLIDGIPVLKLIREHGSPLYVYDTSTIISQYNRMMKALKETRIKINYAAKALSNLNILKLIKELGGGLDAVSIQEVKLGLKAGFDPKDIIYTPNCVGMQEIHEVADLGVRINIDNISILELFGHHYSKNYPVCIRINPHIMAGSNSKISTGHIDSKFGISIYQLPHVLRVVETNDMVVEGLHMHTGSDILDVEVFLKGAEILLDTARNFRQLEYIDYGSGFKVAYRPGDMETNIEEVGKLISDNFNRFCKDYGKDLTLIFEPGKYLVSRAGYFIARVNVIKQTPATVFAGLDTGMNHFIRPMFYDAYHEIFNLTKPRGNTRIYTIVGYICETDTFGWNRKITEISEGDYLAFKNAGAYCFAMSSNYNSRYRPAEVLVHKGKDYLIRKREDFDDLVRNQILHDDLSL